MNEQSPHTDIVNDWIIGYLTNSLTPEEMQSLQNWLNVSEENRKYFSDMQEVWIAASDEADEQHFDKERAYQLFLEHTENLVQPSVKRKTLTISPWMYAAAMVVIVFFCGTIAFQSGKRVLRNQLTQITVEAPYGSKTKLYLPDGTLVWLNAGSKMSYAQDFGINERSLNLSGEAYFEVTRNEEIPFKVHTEELDVKVLGTKFNVQSHESDSEFEVMLYEGCVDVESDFNNKQVEVLMAPGDIIKIDKNTGEMSQMNISTIANPGQSRKFYFIDKKLEDITNQLERHFQKKIVITNPKLKSIKYDAIFANDETIEQILNCLNASQQMKIIYHDNTIIEIR